MNAKSGFVWAVFFGTLLFIILFVQKPGFYNFDLTPGEIVSKYLRSQDIYDPDGKIKDRIFISDSEIYLASGYLYANGANPVDYNFQHPPVLKYLYGYSLKFFGTPYPLQVIFIFLLLFLSFSLAFAVSRSKKVAILTLLLLVLDPLVRESALNVYLDLGQTVFALAFALAFLYRPQYIILQGILLGLLLSSKFWSTSLFFLVALILTRILVKKNFSLAGFLKVLMVSVLTYVGTYLVFFLKGENIFGFVVTQLKMLRFMLGHNLGAYFGSQFWLFLTGFYKDWWRNGNMIRSDIWSPLWPVSFGALLFGLGNRKLRGKFILPGMVVASFFVASVKGVPFARYLIFVLPYLYISLAAVIILLAGKIAKGWKKRKQKVI